MGFDLVIRGGTVIDGTGSCRIRADVGVAGDRIAAVGRLTGRSAQEIDAAGQFVCPGFIEGHTHLDAQMNWDPFATSSCWHGITTAVMGNCGFTLAPCSAMNPELVMRNIERAEEIPRETMLAGIEWNWESFPQYLDVMDSQPKGINFATYIGHSALRSYVMGERAFSDGATLDEISKMKHELRDALRAGAIGFSTSRAPNHMTIDGSPVASRLADWTELTELLGILKNERAGLFQLDNEKHEAGIERQEYFAKLGDLVVDSGRPSLFMLTIPPNDPDSWREKVALLERVNSEAVAMYGQVHCHHLMELVGFRLKLPFDVLPGWSRVRALPLDKQRSELEDIAVRSELVREAKELSAIRIDDSGRLPASVRPLNYAELAVIDSPVGAHHTVASMARERRLDPVELIIELSLQSDFQQLFGRMLLNFNLEAVLELLRHPNSLLGVSDAGAHVTRISEMSIPTQFLAYWVREREEFGWEEAIAMLSSKPARIFGLNGRGTIAPGTFADLVVFDPATISPLIPAVSYDFPKGAKRLTQRSRGITATVVNGKVITKEGAITGALPGRILRATPRH